MFGCSDITFIHVRLLFALIQTCARQSARTPVARCFIGDDTAAAAPYAAFDRAQHRDCRCDHAVAVEERSTHYADAQRSVPITTSWIRHRITSNGVRLPSLVYHWPRGMNGSQPAQPAHRGCYAADAAAVTQPPASPRSHPSRYAARFSGTRFTASIRIGRIATSVWPFLLSHRRIDCFPLDLKA
jgi:hypothetical protein